MVEKGSAQKRVVRGSVEEWVIFEIKLDVIGQVLSPLIKIQSTNNYFINSSHRVSSPVMRLKATVLYFVITHICFISSDHLGKQALQYPSGLFYNPRSGWTT